METIALDVHAHLIPIMPERLAEHPEVVWSTEAGTLSIDGHTVGMKQLFSSPALLAWMDENAVAHALISTPPPTYRQHLAADEAAGWCGYLNDGLIALAARAPDRLSPLLHLPVEHPEIAIAIARHGIGNGDVRYAMAAGAPPKAMLSDAEYAPLWQVLNDAGGFLFLHPGEGCDPRMDPFYLQNLLGNPVETGIAAAHLVLSGILERYTKITICLAHGGGVAPAVAGRLERGHATSRPGMDKNVEPPHAGFRRLCADCIVHSAGAFDLAEQTFGADHMFFGSDWPFPMGLPKPHAQLSGLAPEQRRRLFADNPLARR